MILERVNKWLKTLEKYLFTYSDGFFVLPYLYNSPELMISYLSNMPMTKHKPDEQAIYSDSPFAKGILRYREIEKGLWLMISEMNFKVNMRTNAQNDNEQEDYYFLAFSTYQNKIPISDMKINDILLPSKSWAIYKPGATIDAMHFKGTQGLYFNFVMKKEWIEENLIQKTQNNSTSLFEMIDSESGIESWENMVFDTEIKANKLWKNLSEGQNSNHLQIKIQTLELIATFFQNIKERKLRAKNQFYSTTDQLAMMFVEKKLIDNLTKDFPGIEKLAKDANMSPSKLKLTFKMVYEQPIFQFYRNKQMDLAMFMLKTSDIQIKNLSSMLGYENPSKFTAFFKKYHHILPSEVTKTMVN